MVGYKNDNLGFTIVELLVVIVVIGVLAAITIVSYTGISQRAVAASLQSDLSSASKQLGLLNIDNSYYPSTIDCGQPDSVNNKCLKSSGGNVYTYYQSNNTVSPQTFSLEAMNGTTCYAITNNSSPTSTTCHWFVGKSSTAMAGKLVYYQDLSKTDWGPDFVSCGNPQCQTSLDSVYPSYYSFVSPQTYPAVDFSSYNAQIECKSVGGRLPYVNELNEIYNNRASYGNNFDTSTYYWSATQMDGVNARALIFTNGALTWGSHNNIFNVRCVRG